jgi:hypothetical protein
MRTACGIWAPWYQRSSGISEFFIEVSKDVVLTTVAS